MNSLSDTQFKKIAVIRTEFPAKFGIPRQSGLVAGLIGEIIFCPEYRKPGMLSGIEEFSHLWLLWEFSETRREDWSATVYPPRLGGKVKKGVFATRSPFRPNPIGLSCVKLEEVISESDDGPKLVVSGADLMDGTPIYDIKPYLPYADAYPDAAGGFGQEHGNDRIEVVFPQELLERLPDDRRRTVCDVLGQDPRAAYQKHPDYLYGMEFAGYDIRFRVEDGVLTVCDVIKTEGGNWEKVK